MSSRITWLGHATVLLEIGGARLLTDPVLRARIAHLRRSVPVPADPAPVDAVLISHVHHDHLDRPSLRRFAGAEALAPAGSRGLLAGLRVREVRAGERVSVAGVAVDVVAARHQARRRPGTPVLDALGFVAGRVWFAGDTDLHDGMSSLRGAVDVALVPVWGWGPSLGPGHLDPERAARAVALIEPAVAIPIHWGTYLPYGSRRRDLLVVPPREFAAYAAELAPATRVVVLSPGESLSR
jgi:L-ascorbate metabolism protein UlaG (beta-lactamase superfamily)